MPDVFDLLGIQKVTYGVATATPSLVSVEHIVLHSIGNDVSLLYKSEMCPAIKRPDKYNYHFIVGPSGKVEEVVPGSFSAIQEGKCVKDKTCSFCAGYNVGIKVLSEGHYIGTEQLKGITGLCAAICYTSNISSDRVYLHSELDEKYKCPVTFSYIEANNFRTLTNCRLKYLQDKDSVLNACKSVFNGKTLELHFFLDGTKRVVTAHASTGKGDRWKFGSLPLSKDIQCKYKLSTFWHMAVIDEKKHSRLYPILPTTVKDKNGERERSNLSVLVTRESVPVHQGIVVSSDEYSWQLVTKTLDMFKLRGINFIDLEVTDG